VDRLLSPEEGGHLARFDLAQIHFGGLTRRSGTLGGFPRGHEGHRGQHRANRAGTGGGGYQELAPTLVDFGDGIVGRVIAHSMSSGTYILPAAWPREAAHYTHADQR